MQGIGNANNGTECPDGILVKTEYFSPQRIKGNWDVINGG
jgi:hypothetical protein